ncbi:MAG: cysteine dioxygenase, partial [Pseudomonadota bacterium]
SRGGVVVEQTGNRYRFEKRNSYEAGVGSAGCLIPPFEYHSIGNPCDRGSAVSLHIYGGDMTSCNIFAEGDDGWYTMESRPLGFDS